MNLDWAFACVQQLRTEDNLLRCTDCLASDLRNVSKQSIQPDSLNGLEPINLGLSNGCQFISTLEEVPDDFAMAISFDSLEHCVRIDRNYARNVSPKKDICEMSGI